MAKVSAHGKIIGTVYLTTKAKRYMSDGKCLVNHGFGWKLQPLKAGLSAADAYTNQVAHQEKWKAAHPVSALYQAELHEIAPMSDGKRARLHLTIGMMPEDPDGVWSECCDSYGDKVSADLDDIVKLCRLYRAAMLDAKERREESVAA